MAAANGRLVLLHIGDVAQLFGEQHFIVQIFGRFCLCISEVHVLVTAARDSGGRQ